MRDIRRIFVHCTAGSQKQTLKQLLQEFKNKGWKNPGYHYIVFPNGNIEQPLSENEVSNGVQGYNSTSINIAYVGGIDNKGRAIDNRTEAQKNALLEKLIELKKRYPNAHIMGHRDIWGKDKSKWKKMCPCFDAEAEYAHLDNLKIDKYDDACGEDELGNTDTFPTEPVEPAHSCGMPDADASSKQPETYVLEHHRDYTGLLKTLRPW